MLELTTRRWVDRSGYISCRPYSSASGDETFPRASKSDWPTGTTLAQAWSNHQGLRCQSVESARWRKQQRHHEAARDHQAEESRNRTISSRTRLDVTTTENIEISTAASTSIDNQCLFVCNALFILLDRNLVRDMPRCLFSGTIHSHLTVELLSNDFYFFSSAASHSIHHERAETNETLPCTLTNTNTPASRRYSRRWWKMKSRHSWVHFEWHGQWFALLENQISAEPNARETSK